MTNNDVLRRLRYTFDYSDTQMMDFFSKADFAVTRSDISDWLKKEDDPSAKPLLDIQLAIFLNGMINHYRGKKEGEQQEPEKKLNNNIILRKLRIALNLKDEDMLRILGLAEMDLSKHELSAFFRNPNQSQYRACHDQVMRNFLHGLQLQHRQESK